AIDRDRRPYGTDPSQSRLVEIAPVRIIPVRVSLDDPATFAEAMAFVRRTSSRVVVVPLPLLASPRAAELSEPLGAPVLLIVLPGPTHSAPVAIKPPWRERVIVVGALPAEPAAVHPNAGLDVVLLPPAAAREAPGDGARAPRNAAEA